MLLFHREANDHQESDSAKNEANEEAPANERSELEPNSQKGVKHCKNPECDKELPSTSTSDYCEDCQRDKRAKQTAFVGAALATAIALGRKYAKPILMKTGKTIVKRF